LCTAMLMSWPVLATAYTYERLDRDKAVSFPPESPSPTSPLLMR
jgi:hypothetical protein